MDSQGLRTLGVYSIPYECGHLQTGCLSNMRLKEHHEYVYPEHSNRSAKAQHHTHLQNTSILSTKPMDDTRMSREVTNTEFHFNSTDMEDGICFRKSWKPLVSSMNDCKKPPSLNPLVGFSNGSQRSMNTTLRGYHSFPLQILVNPEPFFPSQPLSTVLALLMTDDMLTTHGPKFSPTFLSSLHMHTWIAGVKV